ncbi:MAG: sugar phosphate nucleotidyltransferase [Candidatus Veblenbacteria bacterium]|nr:sugar phosphate nucleotidyltransferase [Candidatus Veblenbacteria bacterium]
MFPPVVIAAAGRGTRMKELSTEKPKHLIEVNGKPFLYYLLFHIQRAGFRRIIIITGHLAEQFDSFAAQYRTEFPGLELVNQYAAVGQERYGSLLPLLAVRNLVGPEPFLVANGDHLYSVRDLSTFRDLHDDYHYVAATTVADPTKFGTLVTNSDQLLVRVDEKVSQPVTNLINAGLYRFTPEVFTAADTVELSPRGEYEITDAITRLAEERKVKVVPLQDYWLAFGRPQDIASAEEIVNNHYQT